MASASFNANVCVCINEPDVSEEHSDSLRVQASTNKKEISVLGTEDVPLRTFKFDVSCPNFKDGVLELIADSAVKDVMMGFNQILFLCRLSESNSKHNAEMVCLSSVMLESLYSAICCEKKVEASLYVSCFEVIDENVFDLLQNTNPAIEDLKLPNQGMEINGLTENPITNECEIDKFLETLFSKTKESKCVNCNHTIFSSMVIGKGRNSDGFECMKIGRLILVDLGSCFHFLSDVSNCLCSRRESFHSSATDLALSLNNEKQWDCCLNKILKPYLGNAKISMIMTLPSILRNLEQDLGILQIVSEIQNTVLRPEINEKVILRESLKDYAEEIKTLEKDLEALQNNSGVPIDQSTYISLGNKLSFVEEQVKELRTERMTFSDAVKNKRDTLTKIHREIMLADEKLVKETQKLGVLKVAAEETKQRKNTLKQKKIKTLDSCIAMKDSIKSLASSVKNQKLHMLKLKNVYNKSTENIKILKEVIANQTNTIISEQAKFRDNIISLLLHLKEMLLNSTAQQSNFLLKANEFHQNFELVLNHWMQHSTSIATEFCNFMEESIKNCKSLETKLCLEFKPLDSTQDKIIDIGLKNKEKIAQMIACCTSRIQMSLETCIKLLYEILCLLEIVQTKMKKQLKALESTISYCTKERLQSLSSIHSSAKSIHQYFIEQSELLKRTKSNAVDHHQELEMNVHKEFVKIKEALASIKNLFSLQQKFSFDNWNQSQGHLLKTKQVCEDSALLFRQCTLEDRNLLDKLEQQSSFNVRELQSLLKDQTETIATSSKQLLNTFDEVNSDVKNFSEERAKIMIQLENDIKDGLKVQDEEVRKHIKTAQLLVEDIMQYINEGIQNTRNSVLSCEDLATNKDVNNTISELKNNVNEYISKYESVKERNKSALRELPEIAKLKIENPEELVEFNHEELLSSTPSSHVEKSKFVVDEKMKLLNKVKKVVAMSLSQGNQSSSNLDGNESVVSLPNIGVGNKKVLERAGSRSFIHKRASK